MYFGFAGYQSVLKIMAKNIVVLIGGPGSGKTTLIDALKDKGFYCYPEISREVTAEAQKKGIDQLFLVEPLLFSKLLLEGRIKQYENAKKEKSDTVFLDRGIPDVLAYMDFLGDNYPSHFDVACKENKYSKIFILPPWEAIYQSDTERYENFEQATVLYNYLKKTYHNYGYELIEIPIGSIEDRLNYLLDNL